MNKIQISQSIKVLVGVIVVSVISFPIAASAAPLVIAPPPTPTAVPEPFTIIGTLVGGTAAFRIRKKLKAISK